MQKISFIAFNTKEGKQEKIESVVRSTKTLNILMKDNYSSEKGYFIDPTSIKQEDIYITREQAQEIAEDVATMLNMEDNASYKAVCDIVIYAFEQACIVAREEEEK